MQNPRRLSPSLSFWTWKSQSVHFDGLLISGGSASFPHVFPCCSRKTLKLRPRLPPSSRCSLGTIGATGHQGSRTPWRTRREKNLKRKVHHGTHRYTQYLHVIHVASLKITQYSSSTWHCDSKIAYSQALWKRAFASMTAIWKRSALSLHAEVRSQCALHLQAEKIQSRWSAMQKGVEVHRSSLFCLWFCSLWLRWFGRHGQRRSETSLLPGVWHQALLFFFWEQTFEDFFPTCQVRVVRNVSWPASACSSAGPQLQALANSKQRFSCRTSTASSGSECSQPDLNHKESPKIYQIERMSEDMQDRMPERTSEYIRIDAR